MKRLAITFVLAQLASVTIALVWRDQGLIALLAGKPPVPMMTRLLVRMTGLLAFGLAGALPVGVVATFVLRDTTLRNWLMVAAGVASAAHFLDEIVDAECLLDQEAAPVLTQDGPEDA